MKENKTDNITTFCNLASLQISPNHATDWAKSLRNF